RYPVRDASQIALRTVIEFLQDEPHQLELVSFVLFDAGTLASYETSLMRLQAGWGVDQVS
ncbi:MAG: hypothetical protein JWN98_166, partial [Abditibacteriota bacterium]|nr:hypothetical protein [Abditibacteriota bacterium]